MKSGKLYLFAALVVLALSVDPCVANSATVRSTVVTIAGDGRDGFAAGNALTSHFIVPVGVSVAPDQSTIITDAGANVIYRLRHGQIERLAGALGTINNDVGVRGGYHNGPALDALFRRPSAAVQRPDGAIYVADTGNHCIRLISHGSVEDFAGSSSAGTTDGTLKNATFKNPIGLANDSDGNLFVVDYSVGIRQISPDGTVKTLPFGGPEKNILGIATAQFNGHKLIAYTEVDAIHLVFDGNDHAFKASDARVPAQEGVPIFHGWGIAILNENTVVVTDPMTSVIRLIRFPSPPFWDSVDSKALSGTLHEDTDFHGGFQDGTNVEALYAAPRAIVGDSQGGLIIADTGNRRIRRLSGFDSRESVLTDFSNFATEHGKTNVVILGASMTSNGVLYPDSIAANVEATFELAASAGRLKRHVHVQAIRADGLTFQASAQLATEYLVDRGTVDVIVFLLNANHYAQSAELVAEANSLAANHIRMVVALAPGFIENSILETPYNDCACILDGDLVEVFRHNFSTLESAYKRAGIQTISLVDPMNTAEEQPNRSALDDMADLHNTPAGQRIFGKILADAMLHDQTWLSQKKPEFKPIIDVQRESCPTEAVDSIAFGSGSVSTISTKSIDRLANNSIIKADELPIFEGWQASNEAAGNIYCISVDGMIGVAATALIHQLSFDAMV